ncbi:MAG: ferredoxin family protein [Chloroflexota bacterium]
MKLMKLWRKPFDTAENVTRPGKVMVSKERCKGCGYCVEFCPRKALNMSDELGPKGYRFAVPADANQCLSCGLCDIICPEFAVRVLPGDNQGTEEVD